MMPSPLRYRRSASVTRACAALVVLAAAACGGGAAVPGGAVPPTPEDPSPPPETEPVDTVWAAGPPQTPTDLPPAVGGPAAPSTPERILASMSLRDKAAQMIMPVVLGDYTPEGTPGHDRIVRLIEEEHVGGVIVSVGTPTDVAVKLNDLQRHSAIPLLVAADLETGAGFRMKGAIHSPTNIVLGGATDFPSLMAVGATGKPGLAYEMGRVTAREARAVGIHVTFAPVLDVNSNPDNPIINVRSFGEDPTAVGMMGSAFVRGVEEHGAIATAKHFPGHGDTETDSHLELPVIRADRTRLDSVELRPFQEAIDAGIGGVMTAHIAVPSLNGGNGDPSTLSTRVLTGLLRDEMGFGGLLFTDAMDMGAINRRYGRSEAAVRAVEAGADVIVMPPSPTDAIEGIVNAVCCGRIPEERIDRSVLRILRAKERMGLFEKATVELDSLPRIVGIPEHRDVSETVARESITLLKNGRDLLPLAGTRNARVLSVTYRRENDLLAGRWFDGTLRGTYPRLTTQDVTRDTGPSVYDELLAEGRRADLVVVSLYVTAVSYSGSVAIPEEVSDYIESLADAGVPHVVISFGNPYLIREFPSARAYVLAWSGAEASQRAAADALFARFAITGRSPTRIPPLFEIGDGIQMPAVDPAGAR